MPRTGQCLDLSVEFVIGTIIATASIFVGLAAWLWPRSRHRSADPDDKALRSGPMRRGIRAVDSVVRVRRMKARNQDIAIETDRTVLDAKDLDIE